MASETAPRPRLHAHDHACDCHAHRSSPQRDAGRGDGPAHEGQPGLWSSLFPVLACAVCPACLSTYAKLFSVAGVGLGLSEAQHDLLLGVAIAASLGVSAWRSRRSGRVWPLAVALAGASLVLAGHLLGEVAWMEWAGVLILLAGGLIEHFRLRRLAATASSAAHV